MRGGYLSPWYHYEQTHTPQTIALHSSRLTITTKKLSLRSRTMKIQQPPEKKPPALDNSVSRMCRAAKLEMNGEPVANANSIPPPTTYILHCPRCHHQKECAHRKRSTAGNWAPRENVRFMGNAHAQLSGGTNAPYTDNKASNAIQQSQ